MRFSRSQVETLLSGTGRTREISVNVRRDSERRVKARLTDARKWIRALRSAIRLFRDGSVSENAHYWHVNCKYESWSAGHQHPLSMSFLFVLRCFVTPSSFGDDIAERIIIRAERSTTKEQ